jgi:hypothetical protein
MRNTLKHGDLYFVAGSLMLIVGEGPRLRNVILNSSENDTVMGGMEGEELIDWLSPKKPVCHLPNVLLKVVKEVFRE